MRYAADRPFADPEKAARRILEIAKRTEKRALAATRKRHAHRMAIDKSAEAEAVESSETAAKLLTDMTG